MQQPVFYRLGKGIYQFKWPIIVLWVLLVIGCFPFLPNIVAPFKTTGFIDENSKSAIAERYLNKQLGFDNKNKFIVMYYSPTLLATNPTFLKKMKQSLRDFKDFHIKNEIIYPDSKHQISKDKHTAYAVIILKTKEPIADELIEKLNTTIKTPTNMSVTKGGEPFFVESITKQTQIDLYRADFIAMPATIITLLFVFGSCVAAIVPIILGGGCALIILTTLYFLGHLFTLSIFTLNIALLLGLCLNLDYALFIISRFREELEKGLTIQDAIAETQSHAGKAIFFSGLAVAASLSALFLFPINILFSVAMGGMIAVFIAMLIALLLLPAVLSTLGAKINALPVSLFRKNKHKKTHAWRWLATKIVHRPLVFFFPILIFLLMLGYPFLSAILGVSDQRIFPENSENRTFYNAYATHFNSTELMPISLLITSKSSPILSKKNIYEIYDLAKTLKKNPLIKKVESIVTTDSKLTKEQYYTLYHTQKSLDTTAVKQLLSTTTRSHFTQMTIVSKYPNHSKETKKLIQYLQNLKNKGGLNIQLTGQPISDKQVLDSILHTLPYAIVWIMVFSYVILLLLLRSLFLPFKAIIMNILSLCASYGALVLVFQEGYLSHFLNFEPQGILDISLLVIIFCALFGFSMDYEVFLLSRIKEFYELQHDNNKSIIFGIDKSSRIITSAALIVIVLCSSFLVAEVLMVKAFGLGIAVAIFVDAFLIRTFLVPSTMTFLKKWNWYLPKWLDKILPNF